MPAPVVHFRSPQRRTPLDQNQVLTRARTEQAFIGPFPPSALKAIRIFDVELARGLPHLPTPALQLGSDRVPYLLVRVLLAIV